MKALFYRTFTVNQGSTLAAFLAVLLLCVLPIPWLTWIFFPVLWGSLPMLFLFQRDQRDRWHDLASVLPIPPGDVVKEKYLLAGLCALGYPWCMTFGLAITADAVAQPTLDLVLFATGSLLCFFALFLPLALGRGGKGVWVPYLFLAILFYAIECAAASLLYYPAGLPISNHFDLFPWVLLLGALLFLASYPVAVGRYARQKGSAPAVGRTFRPAGAGTAAIARRRVRGKAAPLRALLYKDGLLIRKQMLAFLIPASFFLVVIRFPMGSVDLCFLPLLGIVVPLQLLALDEQAQWTFSLRLYPYPPRSLVLSRYLWGWISLLLGLGLDVGTAYLLYPNYLQLPIPTETPFFLFWITGVVLAVQAVEIPLLFRIGVVHGKIVSLALLLVLFLVLLNVLAEFNPNNPSAAFAYLLPTLKALSPAALLAGLAANLLSIPLAVREYRLTAAAA